MNHRKFTYAAALLVAVSAPSVIAAPTAIRAHSQAAARSLSPLNLASLK